MTQGVIEVNTAQQSLQTGTERSLWDRRTSVWDRGYSMEAIYDSSDEDFDFDGRGRERHEAAERRVSDISNWWKQRVESEYFHILLCELRIYLDQTRSDCGNKPTLFEIRFILLMSSVCYDELTRLLSAS